MCDRLWVWRCWGVFCLTFREIAGDCPYSPMAWGCGISPDDYKVIRPILVHKCKNNEEVEEEWVGKQEKEEDEIECKCDPEGAQNIRCQSHAQNGDPFENEEDIIYQDIEELEKLR